MMNVILGETMDLYCEMPRRQAMVWIGMLLGGLSLTAETAQAQAPQITPDQASKLVEEGKLVLIDIRTPEEWRQTGVPKGAQRITMGASDFVARLTEVTGGDRTKAIGLICRTGNRSSHLQAAMLRAGYSQTIDVMGGVAGSGSEPGWIRRGLPIEKCDRC